jgi:hypothetical protein
MNAQQHPRAHSIRTMKALVFTPPGRATRSENQ